MTGSFTNREKIDIRPGSFHARPLLYGGMTVTPEANKSNLPDRVAVREFYDQVYYRDTGHEAQIPRHYRLLAHRFELWSGKRGPGYALSEIVKSKNQ